MKAQEEKSSDRQALVVLVSYHKIARFLDAVLCYFSRVVERKASGSGLVFFFRALPFFNATDS
jgi:hypothetical protein